MFFFLPYIHKNPKKTVNEVVNFYNKQLIDINLCTYITCTFNLNHDKLLIDT